MIFLCSRHNHPRAVSRFHIETNLTYMTTLEIKGNWNVIKGKLKQKYGQLTDDDLAFVQGKEEELLGRVQSRLGRTKEEVRAEIERFGR